MSGHPLNILDAQIILWFYITFFVGGFIYRGYEEQRPSAQEVRNIVNMYLSEKENLDNTLPVSIVIGPFHVSTEVVKQNLTAKYKALATSMLDILAKNLHLQVESVSYLVQQIVCQCLVLSCFWSCCVCEMAKRQQLRPH